MKKGVFINDGEGGYEYYPDETVTDLSPGALAMAALWAAALVVFSLTLTHFFNWWEWMVAFNEYVQ